MMDFLRILVEAYEVSPNMALNLLNNMETITGIRKDPAIIIGFLGGFPKDIQANMITSIKYIREQTGLGLKEAKDLYDRLIPRKTSY